MNFRIEVYREWTETGSIVVEADCEEDAREIADEALLSGDQEIEWDGSNMEPGQQGIEGCIKLE